MMMRTFAVVSFALLAGACGGSQSSSTTSTAPAPVEAGPELNVGLRVAHVANAPGVTAALGQYEIPGNLTAGNLSPRVGVPAGSRTLELSAGGNTVATKRLTLDANGDYTAWVVGSAADSTLDVIVTPDEFPAPSPGTAFVRFLNASSQASPLEFLADGRGYASDITFKGLSNYVSVPAGGTRFEARGAAEASVGVNFEAGRVYTVIAHELGDRSLGLTFVIEN